MNEQGAEKGKRKRKQPRKLKTDVMELGPSVQFLAAQQHSPTLIDSVCKMSLWTMTVNIS